MTSSEEETQEDVSRGKEQSFLVDVEAIPQKSETSEDDYRPSSSPDRAISIVSELKANASLFAAFAFGSLNLPSTLTVSESKVTSVTTSLSISRPVPESHLIQAFVILDVSTLCLMISCVAASQLLIYRLTDGSYEEYDYRSHERRNKEKLPTRPRESALGRLSTQYRNEFTVARITFDLGLVTLLFAVAVRTLAIFDEDIALPVTAVIGVTSLFLATAYLTSYFEVFRRVENQQTTRTGASSGENGIFRFATPPALILVGLVLYFITTDKSSVQLPSFLDSYGITTGESKLRVVTEKVEAGRTKDRKKRVAKASVGKSASEKAEAAAERAAAEKVTAEKAVDKAAADKVAAEKAVEKATEKAIAAEKAAEKATAAEKTAADKLAAEKAAEKAAAAEKVVASGQAAPGKATIEKSAGAEKAAPVD